MYVHAKFGTIPWNSRTVAAGNAKNIMQEKGNNDHKQEVNIEGAGLWALKKSQNKHEIIMPGYLERMSHQSKDSSVITSSERITDL